MSITFNTSDIGYMDPEWSNYIWDPINKLFVERNVLEERGFENDLPMGEGESGNQEDYGDGDL
jgi:hypothetical protein